MSNTVLMAKGDYKGWRIVVAAYDIIKGLEDGCSVKDIHDLLPEPKPSYPDVSKAVSNMAVAKNTPLATEKHGTVYTKLRAIAPLPDALYADESRVKRGYHVRDPLEGLDRVGLLKLKLAINARLAELDKPA